MQRIIGPDTLDYIAYRKTMTGGTHNGAYYYSKEIVRNIIPNVETDRPWDTLGIRACGSMNDAIVFIHHCRSWDKVYWWLGRYRNQILVCSTMPTYRWAKRTGRQAIFLPLSIDVEEVKQYQREKTKEACYAGNRWAFKEKDRRRLVPKDVDYPPKNLPREELLRFIAPYKKCYAIGRCALEAKALGCEIGVCYSKYPDPDYWKVLDNKDAAKRLQRALNRIDKEANAS